MTPLEKQQKKARDNLRIINNRLLAKFSFKEIKTWRDAYHHLGFTDDHIAKNYKPEHLLVSPTYPELKSFCDSQLEELEKSFSKNGASTGIQLIMPKLVVTNESWITPDNKVHSIKSDKILEALDEFTTSKTAPSIEQQVEPLPEPKHELTSKDNYGYTRDKVIKAFLYWFQKKATVELKTKIVDEKKSGVLLLSGTGTGKTFIIAALDEWLKALDWHEGRTWSHIPRLYVTKTTVVEQASRVFKNFFGIEPNVDTEIINIEQLRSSAGQLWVKEEVKIQNGEEVSVWKWKDKIQPTIIYFDESQGAKNKGSKQSRIIYAYNDLPRNTCLVSVSATPFTRVSEAQAFAVSTHRPLEHLKFPKGTVLTNDNWPSYAAIISYPSKPDEYNQAAIERLMKDLEPWIVRVRGVRPQFEAINGVKVIDFETPEKRKWYNDAWVRFEEEMAKIKAAKEAGQDTGVCQLVVLLKFSMAAEFCHADHFAKDMYECWKRGKAPVAAVKFKQTLIEIVRLLIEKYGMTRDNISLVWGGGQTQLTKKQKAKEKVKSLEDKFKKMGIEMDEMIVDMGLEDVEDRVIVNYPAEWRLESQSMIERQREIDKFQSGKSEFCIYTLKAGGVGLSLHHTDELTPQDIAKYSLERLKSRAMELKHPLYNLLLKDLDLAGKEWRRQTQLDESLEYDRDHWIKVFGCRRKESGYAVEGDIENIPVRPRETFVVVTYNAIELVQGVGRVPRLTSLSPTTQNVYCYAGTVEVDMGRIYSQKLRCLSSVVKMHESWQDCIFGGANRHKVVQEIIDKTKNVANDESSSMIDEEDDEE